ncbi:alpha/beta fold hydrolase [Nocardia sp. NPDC052566]|uniref:alpha/beta fold hydrolase n=1 Tax=Nocardia sp. NPDC052566 TaxID=3364330 RepID=UPI0037CBB5B8
MNPTSTTPVTARTLEVPGARLHFEVRGAGSLVVLVGAPMVAAAFAPLADLLAAGHTVLTTDPRGVGASVLDDPAQDSTPELRADDLARLITHLDAGPAVVFGSSGGAVTALALAQARPDLVTKVIAHEPPLVELLDDRAEMRKQTEDLVAIYQSGDVLGAWRKFFGDAGIELPEQALEQMFGGDRDPAQVADESFWFNHEIRGSTFWQPDLERLRAVSARLVIGIGETSTGQTCDRTSRALADLLGLTPTMFPGDHTGFVGEPDIFDHRLRAVLGD